MGDDSRPRNFIGAIIEQEPGGGDGHVVTRFPPEPNGYLHIGHAKSICLNFGLASRYSGRCHLRFDDTNPLKEEVEYVDAIKDDVRWLGFDWGPHLYFASDYFHQLYEWSEHLVREGLAFVCDLSAEEVRAWRGTLKEPGRNSPWRERSVEENLDLFRRMRAGEFPDGSRTLRARIDMAAPNLNLRDPVLYRIMRAHHHRTGDDWCIYPTYDWAHGQSDAIEGITHSICTLEFEDHRPLYDWFLDHLPPTPSRPRQIEFARLNLNYTVMSKRMLLALVREGHVDGWDDPRMPTIAGIRRRGFTPAAIRDFTDRIGVARADSVVDLGMLEACARDDLNPKVPRATCVHRPLKLVITTWPEDHLEQIQAPWFPDDPPRMGSRSVTMCREIWVERDDFMEVPARKWHRLAPGKEVRLRWSYVVRCDEVVKDKDGQVVELRCSHDPDSLHGVERRVKGTIHWLSAQTARPAQVRLYDRLFKTPNPAASEDFRQELNPDSLEELQALVEPDLASAATGDRFQFERKGYYFVDPKDSRPGAPVFHRLVTLRDSWARRVARGS